MILLSKTVSCSLRLDPNAVARPSVYQEGLSFSYNDTEGMGTWLKPLCSSPEFKAAPDNSSLEGLRTPAEGRNAFYTRPVFPFLPPVWSIIQELPRIYVGQVHM